MCTCFSMRSLRSDLFVFCLSSKWFGLNRNQEEVYFRKRFDLSLRRRREEIDFEQVMVSFHSGNWK